MYVVYRDNNDRLLGRYCGQTAPGPVESPRGAVGLRITLHTDQESVASGFKARYFFESAKSDAGDCGGNFSNQDSGLITSPNWPAGYKAPGRGMASNACNWVMKARPGYKLSIHFEQFGLEGDPASKSQSGVKMWNENWCNYYLLFQPDRGCPAAVLRLWMNVDSDQPPLELCGEKPPVEQWHYTSTGQTARISFTTSDKTVGAQVRVIIIMNSQRWWPLNLASNRASALCGPRYRTPVRVRRPWVCTANRRTISSAEPDTASPISCDATGSRIADPATILTNCTVSREWVERFSSIFICLLLPKFT